MAVDRLTGCSAIIVPRRIAHATRTQCLSMPVPFLGLRANILFLSTTVGIVPTEPSRRGTGPLNRALLHCKTPIERPVQRSVAALLTGSSRQRPNGFIGRTQPRVGLDGAPICYSAPNICSPLPMVAISPWCGQGWGTAASSPSILNGNSLNPVDAKGALPPANPRLKRSAAVYSNESRMPAQ
jgi:hypothetical protein